MREFRFIALTPAGLVDPTIAIAAGRAGEIGVLDLQYPGDVSRSLAAISRLGRFAKNEYGLKIDGGDRDLLTEVLTVASSNLQWIILTINERNCLSHQINDCHKLGLTVLLETTCGAEALLGEELGVDGLIAKGHEASGRIGEETTFILLQRLRASTSLPVWAQGGIGLHSVSACYVAGAAGVVLDAQLALTRESTLPQEVKDSIARMDGSETVCLGTDLGEAYRIYSRPTLPVAEELSRTTVRLIGQSAPASQRLADWRREVKSRIGWSDPKTDIWLLGQDASFAASLAKRFQTVGRVLEGLRQAVEADVVKVRTLKPIDKDSPLALSHGTLYPIVQGPMTRVSDKASFAKRVADAGGLPFLALALMRAPRVAALLEETRRMMGDKPWGVGVLGFVPAELRKEQLEVIQEYSPSYALIAGGRPDQALALEHAGIPTYLHVPSPGLLKLFVENGARRFVFEGRECGGHVGPRSSFVLWNTMIDTLLEVLPPSEMAACHVLFAGGIHDATSAAMVATMATPLAEQGIRIGMLMGTAYLFTSDAITTEAIREGFQHEAIRCNETVLLETGPGHATRCAKSPFVEKFQAEKQRLINNGNSPEEIRETLEEMNLGRLRIASKGIMRDPKSPVSQDYLELSNQEQLNQGMYMMGQVAALRNSACTIEQLHEEISVKATAQLASMTEPALALSSLKATEPQPCDIAIVGMSCLLPKASDLQTYWENILNKVNAITEIPRERWEWQSYFDENPKTRDKIYSKWGGFLDSIPFDPVRYGMPPNTLTSIEPLQLLTLEAVRAALNDAGYLDREFARDRAAVILGAGGGIADLGQQYALRAGLPMFLEDVDSEVLAHLPEWSEDSFAGILLNVAAGRVSNRFDLGGVNYTVDAACASSLAAVYLATRELENRTSDVVIVGGVDTVQNPFGYLCFSKTNALSPRGLCSTFDENADGIVISEGIAILVLKRLADAERDGDRIYAVIKAVAGSSDGKGKGLTAPRPEGQARALERAYAKAGFSPCTVGLIEAHGTGTVAGDRAEIETLKRIFERAGASRQNCAIGSVKSNIGHTKCAAGAAGLLKIALALYHRVLPPTINVEKPNSKARFSESPFFINTELRPWINGKGYPRRAAVSAFGFGGTNFHAVVEEYTGDFVRNEAESVSQNWPAELLVFTANSRQGLIGELERIEQFTSHIREPALRDLAYTLWQLAANDRKARLAIVATSLDDLRQKIALAKQGLTAATAIEINDPRGIYFTNQPLAPTKVAFLFPGQGSQSVGMLCDLAIHFREVRDQFELADRLLADRFPERLSSYVYAPPAFTTEERQSRQQALTRTNVAQPALAVTGIGAFHLFKSLEVHPDFVGGHSFGEYVALASAAVLTEQTLYPLAEARGRCIIEAAREDLGTMAAVMANAERTRIVLTSVADVWIANCNAPQQTVISGTHRGIEQAIESLRSNDIEVRSIPVACAFHSPLIGPARNSFAQILSTIEFKEPQIEVYSNSTAAPYPVDPDAIRSLLADHLVTPVRFADEVEAMYQAGARIFIEMGPGSVLTGLTRQILGKRPHLSVAADGPDRSGIVSLQRTLAQLFSQGVHVNQDRLYAGRAPRRLELNNTSEFDTPLPATTWMVDGGKARPLSEAATAGRTQTKLTVDTAAGTKSAQPVVTPKRSVPPPSMAVQSHALGESRDPIDYPSAGKSVDDTNAVMLQFQDLMKQFLETQEQVMMDYLQGATNSLPTASLLQQNTSQVDQGAVALDGEHAAEVSLTAPLTTQKQTPGNGSRPLIQPEASSSPGEINEGEIARKLLQIVSERTGYPPEMLDLDSNIEADLGIDSIKRVEILGAFQRMFLSSNQQDVHETMELFTKVKTLRGIADAMGGVLRTREANKPETESLTHAAEPSPQLPVTSVSGKERPSRFLLQTHEAPLSRSGASNLKKTLFLITDDEQGVAEALALALRSRGAQVALVKTGLEKEPSQGEHYVSNLSDPAAVAQLLGSIHSQQGTLRGIIHLAPLRDESTGPHDSSDARSENSFQLKSLFNLAKAAATDLKQFDDFRSSWIIAATSTRKSPIHAGLAGLIKTLSLEWSGMRHKVVDVDGWNSPTDLAARLLSEITAPDETVEIYFKGSSRLVCVPQIAPLNVNGPVQLELDTNSVILLTGGARGITAEVASELATRYKPTFLIIGRSELPSTTEAIETMGLSTPKDLKRVLMDQISRRGEKVSPARVEAAYSALLRDREIRENLAAMERSGAKIRYFQCDVRNDEKFGSLIDQIYATFGRIDGVVHGAGVIEDKLIEDKTPESFARVFDTKVRGALVLAERLRPESLKFLVFFASVAGRFGNRGQADYAAANEVLNKLATHLDSVWPARVVALNWGPWRDSGMVSDSVAEQFKERGVELISSSDGRNMFADELRYGAKGEVEIILGRGPWAALEKPPVCIDAPVPIVSRLQIGSRGAVEFDCQLDVDRDLYLQDHRLDGKPVLPAAMAAELMAEIAVKGWPDWEVVGLRGFRLLKGVVVKNGHKSIRLVASSQTQLVDENDELQIDVEIYEENAKFPAYRGTIILGYRFPEPPNYDLLKQRDLRQFPMDVRGAYSKLLFHGPRFHCITELHGFGSNGVLATVRTSQPANCLAHPKSQSWVLDPIVLDAGHQLAILWASEIMNMTALPSRFLNLRRFKKLDQASNLKCYFQVDGNSHDHTIISNVYYVDVDDRVVLAVEGLESTCSSSLNRLAKTGAM